ncbi:MAG TPA: hypothetical protein VGP44_02490 [Gemmatimonadales bacterium]|nr:hypothetical protein [Gemmatimonadales bacterium]
MQGKPTIMPRPAPSAAEEAFAAGPVTVSKPAPPPRLPPRRRATITSRDGNERRRMTFYLSMETARAAEIMAADLGYELSEIGEMALAAFLSTRR